MVPKSLKRYAWLSVAAALATILLKGLAWRLTDSVGLLSDAIESFVNLAGALMALGMLSLVEECLEMIRIFIRQKVSPS